MGAKTSVKVTFVRRSNGPSIRFAVSWWAETKTTSDFCSGLFKINLSVGWTMFYSPYGSKTGNAFLFFRGCHTRGLHHFLSGEDLDNLKRY